MNELWIEAQGCVARVRSYSSALDVVVEQLAADFKAFDVPVRGTLAKIELILAQQAPSESSRGRLPLRLFRLARVCVYGWGKLRVCSFANGAVVCESKFVKGIRHFWLSGSDPALAREVGYMLLLSAMGEEMDRRGIHRVHAMGAEVGGRRLLFLAPSGGGKSALATLLLQNDPEAKLFSDESPLLKAGCMLPFPIRLAMAADLASALGLDPDEYPQFRAKRLLPFEKERQARPGEVDILLIGKRVKGEPEIYPYSRVLVFPDLFAGLVVGIGLAQMAEWMLRIDSLPALFRIALSRLVAALRLLRESGEVYRFNLSEDARQNAKCLDRFLAEGGLRRHRLQNRFLLKLILAGDRLTRGPRFNFFHESFRQFYFGPLSRALQYYLRKKHRTASFRLVPRHSVARPGGFSVFRSDIDYSLVVAVNHLMLETSRIARSYESLSRWLPILGELEVYTELEMQLQTELIGAHEPLLRWMRLLRKWTRARLVAGSEYHREKDQLARGDILAKLGDGKILQEQQLGGALEEFINRLHPRRVDAKAALAKIEWQSPYLGWKVTDEELSPGIHQLRLGASNLAVFLALLPDLDDPPAEILAAVAPLRNNREIAKGLSAVLASELITCWSVRRDPRRNDAQMADWIGRLERQLRRYDAGLFRRVEEIKAAETPQA